MAISATVLLSSPLSFYFFFFNDTATTEIYTLSLHDALPISDEPCARRVRERAGGARGFAWRRRGGSGAEDGDRKSTRLNSSHLVISYAVFCLKKKKNTRAMKHLAGKTPRTRGVNTSRQ